jgi:hypothetical protein
MKVESIGIPAVLIAGGNPSTGLVRTKPSRSRIRKKRTARFSGLGAFE